MPTRPRYFQCKPARPARDERLSSHRRGYDSTWRKLRRVKLDRDPLCQHCLERDRTEAATEVDHITPIEDGGARLDLANLQSLCKSCHSKKTARDVRARVGRRGGIGGADPSESPG